MEISSTMFSIVNILIASGFTIFGYMIGIKKINLRKKEGKK